MHGPKQRYAASVRVPKTVYRSRPKMAFIRNSADFLELAGNDTFVGRKINVDK